MSQQGIDLTNPLQFGDQFEDQVWLPFNGYLVCCKGHLGKRLQAGDSLSLTNDLICEVCGKKLYYYILIPPESIKNL